MSRMLQGFAPSEGWQSRSLCRRPSRIRFPDLTTHRAGCKPAPVNRREPPLESGQVLPSISSPPPGPLSRGLRARHAAAAAPMGPPASTSGIVLVRGLGANLWDADDNRYVDLAAGFGSLLLGHGHPAVLAALRTQSERLLLALGDVYPSDVKVELLERLVALYPEPAQALLAQSGSDAVSGALKTAALATGRPGVVAFGGAYHGLGYGPLAACGLRESYREPFAAQLGRHVRFAPYPSSPVVVAESLSIVQR